MAVTSWCRPAARRVLTSGSTVRLSLKRRGCSSAWPREMRLLCSERRSYLSAAPVARRQWVGASLASVSEPGRRLTSDAGRYHVAALELEVAYLVAGAFEPGDDPAAAGVDREPPVPGPVRDEDAWRARLACRRQEPRREGEHVRKQVAVRDPERKGVGGPVGVTPDGHARRIHRAEGEGVLQRPVDGRHVRTVPPAAEDQIPGGSARAQGEQDDACLVRRSPELGQAVARILAGAVQQEGQRGGFLRPVARRH